MKIDKKQALDYFKTNPFLDGDAKINSDGSLTLTINLGVKVEKKLSKTDFILKELKEIKSDISELKDDVKILKREAIKNGWDLTPDKK